MTYTYQAQAYREYIETSLTLVNAFRRNVQRYAGRLAMECPENDESFTYAELGARVDSLAAGLAAAGVNTGDVVAYQLFNGPEFAQLYLAAQAANAVGSPINFRFASGETAFTLDITQPKVFVYDTELSAMVADALARIEYVPPVIVAVGSGEPVTAPPGSKVLRFNDLVADRTAPPEFNRTAWDETTRLYTSGTTGMPKAIPFNSMNEIFTAHDVIMHFPMSTDDTTLNMTPWFHRGGLHCAGPSTTFYLGSSLVPLRVFNADVVLDRVQQFGLTFLVGAPATLEMLARAQKNKPRDLSSLRGIVTMGSPLERDAALRYQTELNSRIFNGYGTTEGFWNTFLRPGDLPGMAGTAGRSCIDDDVAVVRVFDDRLADPDETATQDGIEVGEVIVRSPKCAGEYYDAAEQNQRKYKNGWLYAGDLATWDENSYVTIVGRKDDMLVSGGENVHPVQVEEALNAHTGVADSLVVGVPDEHWGRLVVAYVIAADDSATADALDVHCRTHPMLSGFKRPRAYRFVESLPLSATGKKLHYKATVQAEEEFKAGLFLRIEKPAIQ